MSREKELHQAARAVDGLVYVIGLAGVAAGGLLLRADRPAYAVIVWALTFGAGAATRLLAVVARALADLLSRTRLMTERIDRLDADAPLRHPGRPESDDRWGRLH